MHRKNSIGEKGGNTMIEEENKMKKHGFILEGRKKGMISGVEDVISFDETMALLDTTEGRLVIKGNKLHVSNLNLESGKVSFEGEIESFSYSDSHDKNKKGQSFWSRLFQ